jgi:hypothetical protein
MLLSKHFIAIGRVYTLYDYKSIINKVITKNNSLTG